MRLEGEPLDIAGLLHTPQGKPRVSIFSIAHLGDAEPRYPYRNKASSQDHWMAHYNKLLVEKILMARRISQLPSSGSPQSYSEQETQGERYNQ